MPPMYRELFVFSPNDESSSFSIVTRISVPSEVDDLFKNELSFLEHILLK